jgi:YbgC/YbaW family acyl-CoA thioester hydrolase
MADVYRHSIRVRDGEVDMQRVVFNAHYLAYCDDACEAWFRALNVRAAADGWDAMVKKASIEWSGQATVNDEITIDVHASRWGNTSFDVTYAGWVGDRSVFTCVITYVGVKAGTLETMPPPPNVRAALGG